MRPCISVERAARARQADTVGWRRLWEQMGADGCRGAPFAAGAMQCRARRRAVLFPLSGPCPVCLARMHMNMKTDMDMNMDRTWTCSIHQITQQGDGAEPSGALTGRRTTTATATATATVRADGRWAAGQARQMRHEGAHDCRRVAALVGMRRGSAEGEPTGSSLVSGLSILTTARAWGSESCYRHWHWHLHLHWHWVPHTPAAWRQ
jgi:hypothetical protein